ncbi:MAG: fructuronate reductase [Pseudonocardiales bacterium]|nr:fructuronate reductase [Pseudonocardiales bacterium]
MARRLSLATLDSLPQELRPLPDPRELAVGIVHLGLGAFHRAHQAVFTANAMAATGVGSWAICGVSQRSREVIDQLEPQDGLYTVLEREYGTRLSVLPPLRELLFAQPQIDALIARIAAPAIRIVTLTVTEKGYRHNPASGRLRRADGEIVADAQGRPPRTVVGQLVRGFQARQRQASGPLGVVCCDNLPRNGATVRRLVDEFCAMLPAAEGAPLMAWIGENVAFPSTMVDRIVPAPTAADRRDAAALLGLADHGAVVAEPFSQWVIEDSFVSDRPQWERAGAIMAKDVEPYELMKLRLLNGPHSALAYLGALAGYEYICDFVALDDVAAYVCALMDIEITPTLAVPAGFDLEDYKRELLRRFANPGLRHRTEQIAMDGSQKVPQRLLGTVADRLAAGAEPRLGVLAVAGWMRFVTVARTDDGRALSVTDPLAARISELVAGAIAPGQVVDRLLALREVFGDLADDSRFRTLLEEALALLSRVGALAALRAVAGPAR